MRKQLKFHLFVPFIAWAGMGALLALVLYLDSLWGLEGGKVELRAWVPLLLAMSLGSLLRGRRALSQGVTALSVVGPLLLASLVWAELPSLYGRSAVLIAFVFLSGVSLSERTVSLLRSVLGLSFGFAFARGVLMPGVGIWGPAVFSALSFSTQWLWEREEKPQPPERFSFSIEPEFLFLSGWFWFVWIECLQLSFGSVGVATAYSLSFALGAGILLFGAKPIASLGVGVGALKGILISGATLVILPGLLTADHYPLGAGYLEVLGMFVILAILIWPVLSWLKPGSSLESRSFFRCSTALWVAFSLCVWEWIFSQLSRASGFAVLAGASLLLAGLGKKAFRGAGFYFWLLRVSVIGILIFLIFADPMRGRTPNFETLLDSGTESTHTFTVTRSRWDQDLRLRRNHHELLQSLLSFKENRRQALLGMALQMETKSALVVGGGNPMAVSVLLETPLENLVIAQVGENTLGLAKWFTSEAAASNKRTTVIRTAQGGFGYLRSTVRYFDLILLEEKAPWYEGSTANASVEYLEKVRDRLYPDGVAVQWLSPYQWSRPALASLLSSWRKVFGENVRMVRVGLMPDFPEVAVVGLKSGEVPQFKRPVPSDAFLQNLTAFSALDLGPAQTWTREFGVEPALQMTRPSLEAHSALHRIRLQMGDVSQAYGPNQLLGLLAQMTAESGPSYGALLWTRAVLKFRSGDPEWVKDRAQAVRILGFDPRAEYPEALPKEGQ